jgi:serine/threonine protein kinase HipA of HipAB toxin-antitoxin module
VSRSLLEVVDVGTLNARYTDDIFDYPPREAHDDTPNSERTTDGADTSTMLPTTGLLYGAPLR